VRQRSIHWALLVLASAIAVGQQQVEHDIVAKLLPDGDPRRVANPDPAEKNTAIKQLRSAQKTASGERAVEVAFLLAVYGSDYEKNRDYLIDDLRGCTTPAIKSGCDGNISDYLIALYERGHTDVLKPLMLVGKNSFSPVVAENLGSFLSNLLMDSPDAFFETIRKFPADTQNDLCELAGSSNGAGGQDKLQRIQKELKARNDELSLSCLQAIEAASRQE
jgi:hypothetical protein